MVLDEIFTGVKFWRIRADCYGSEVVLSQALLNPISSVYSSVIKDEDGVSDMVARSLPYLSREAI